MTNRLGRVLAAYDQAALKRVCEMREGSFKRYAERQDIAEARLDPRVMPGNDYLFHADNGAQVLAVAHLDTVQHNRTAHFVDTAAGPVIHSGALDDRLGAYIILEMLPALGIKTDLLLTVGEESGQSTASYFEAPRDYLWMIEFDRMGTDVVMYDYEDAETRAMVRDAGPVVGVGSYSDISYLEHLECKGFNWGVGYQDYHGPRSHAYLNDTFLQVARFLKFWETNHDTYMPHDPEDYSKGWKRSDYDTTGWGNLTGDPAWDKIEGVNAWWDEHRTLDIDPETGDELEVRGTPSVWDEPIPY